MTQHYKDSENNVYGYKPECVDVTPITMDEVLELTRTPEPTIEQWRATASVTSRQGEQQLILSDLDEQVDAAIDAITDTKQRKLTRAWYNRAATWERNNPEFIALGEALGLTPEQMDEHIKVAAKL